MTFNYSSRDNFTTPEKEPGIGRLVATTLWKWGRSNPRSFIFLMQTFLNLKRAERKRKEKARLLGAQLPTVLAVSPSMRCNYNCRGCYSRERNSDNELTATELDLLFGEAEALGISAVVVTGGEPFLRSDMLDLFEKHRRLLFIPITNGSLISRKTARRLAGCGNNMVLVSLEGTPAETDARRGEGAYRQALQAFANLKEAGTCFGFAATNTSANSDYLAGREFIDRMIECGCMVGFYSEYIPSGPRVEEAWLLNEEERKSFRRKVLHTRRTRPIVLVQFPQDEYGEENICSAAGQASLHINSQGFVEPCPFVPVSCDNIRSGGLLEACRSELLSTIRQNPDLLKRKKYACALFEHLDDIEALACRIK